MLRLLHTSTFATLFGLAACGGLSQVTDEEATNTAPLAVLQSPNNGDQLPSTGALVFVLQVSDAESNPFDLEIKLTDVPDGALTGTTEVVDQTATFTTTGNVWTPGLHTVFITVTDPGGLTAEDDVTFEVLTPDPPSLSILAPMDGALAAFGIPLLVEAEVTHPSVPLDEITLAWGGDLGTQVGLPTHPDSDGFVAFTADGFAMGDHFLSVVADDGRGTRLTEFASFEIIDGDADGDGHTTELLGGDDCDDDPATGAGVHPGATEICDEIDNDCDGEVDGETATDRITWYEDDDHDGWGNPDVVLVECEQPFNFVDNDQDCDDLSWDNKPGALEFCDGEDNDCDTDIDEDAEDEALWYPDLDGDNFGVAGLPVSACDKPVNYADNIDDCDDWRGDTYPGADELCDGYDNDCNLIDDDNAIDAPTWYTDNDGDEYGTVVGAVVACDQPTDMIADGTDCNDTDNSIHPGAIEYCNTLDDDCNGAPDDNTVDGDPFYADVDIDGYGDPDEELIFCGVPFGYVEDNTDCDDARFETNPGAIEYCNGYNDDCDAELDEPDANDTVEWHPDFDGDFFGDPDVTEVACAPTDPTWVEDNTDCDDLFADSWPGAPEYCNDRDNDCNGLPDDNPVEFLIWYFDDDLDLYGDDLVFVEECDAPDADEWVLDGGDCNENDPSINPGMPEQCNGDDDDCSGVADDNAIDGTTYYPDNDLDTYGDEFAPIVSCDPISGHVIDGTDCDDSRFETNPGALEYCNGENDDCDDDIDEGDSEDAFAWHPDVDEDTFGDENTTVFSCSSVPDHILDGTDCDDGNNQIFPGAEEECSGADEDCSGIAGDNVLNPPIWHWDGDNDQYGSELVTIGACEAPPGYIERGGDCDDGNNQTNPDRLEMCNSLDDDCSGLVDDNAACPCPVDYYGGHAYQFCPGSKNYYNIKDFECVSPWWELARPDDQAENDWIESKASTYNPGDVWFIGLIDTQSEGNHQWIPPGTSAYLNWGFGKPDDPGHSENCTAMDPATGEWDDVNCNDNNSYVCETR